MLLQINENLEEKIVRLLGLYPKCTVSQLQNLLTKNKSNYSIQAIYKELRKLQRVGVVVKVNKHYTLRLSWLDDLKEYLDQIQERGRAIELPKPKEKLAWTFTSLKALDDFTVQTILLLFKQVPGHIMYEWTGHPWYQLLQKDKEESFIRIMTKAKNSLYCLVGGKTKLDKVFNTKYPSSSFRMTYYEGALDFARDKHVFVISNYIYTATLGYELSNKIDKMYETSEHKNGLDLRDVVNTFNSNCRIKVHLENNQSKAVKLLKKFGEYF